MPRFTSIVLAGPLSLMPLAHGQSVPRASPVPRPVTELLNVRSAEAQQLLLAPVMPGEFTVRIRFGGTLHTMHIEPHEIRSPGFRLLVDYGSEIRQVATPPSTTYRGMLLGEPGSAVAATYINGVLRASMSVGGHVWTLQPVSDAQPGLLPGTYVVYERAELQQSPFTCGFTETAPADPDPPVAAAAEDSGHRIADLAIDADEAYYRHHDNSVLDVQNEILELINAVDVIYNRDVGIGHRISTILVRTVPTYTSRNTSLLSEFRDRWNLLHNDIERDVAHLFSGNPYPGNVVGIAYLNAICRQSRAYGVSWTLFSEFSLEPRVSLTAHELGHNWGANHCDAYATCDIMCSSISGCGPGASFGVDSQADIGSFRDSRSCLDTDPIPLRAPSVSSISPSAVTAFSPDQVMLGGDDLDMVAEVTVGGMPAEFSIVGKNLLNLSPPSLDISTHQVVVSNSMGSDSIEIEILGNHPSVVESPPIVVPGIPATYRVHTDREWQGLLVASPSIAPSILPGIIELDLGKDFTQIAVAPVIADASGVAEIELTVPLGFPYLVPIYWQAVMFEDPANLTFPLETSERVPVWTSPW